MAALLRGVVQRQEQRSLHECSCRRHAKRQVLDEVVGSAGYVAVETGHVFLVGKLASPSGHSTFADDATFSETEEIPAQLPQGRPAWSSARCGIEDVDGQPGEFYGLTSNVVLPNGGRDCQVDYINYQTPCVKPQKVNFVTPYLGGRPAGTIELEPEELAFTTSSSRKRILRAGAAPY